MLPTAKNTAPPKWGMAVAIFTLMIGLVLGAHTTMAQMASTLSASVNHDQGGPACEFGNNALACGAPQRCCVRVKKKQRVIMPGKRRTRTVLTGWRCYTGPQAMRLCQRMRH